jgi:hypothetical protein
MGLRPGWRRGRGKLGGDGGVVELEGRRDPRTGSGNGAAAALQLS